MTNAIDKILAATCAVRLLAKDLHYRASGKAFYAEHLLADAIADIEKSNDDLIEVYYLGQEGNLPPLMWEIHSNGVALAARGLSNENADGEAVLAALIAAVDGVVQAVEDAKRDETTGGLSSVLDEISKNALVAKALLSRTEDGEGGGGGFSLTIATDGACDCKNTLLAALSKLGKTATTDKGTSEGAKKGWETRRRGGGGNGGQASGGVAYDPKTDPYEGKGDDFNKWRKPWSAEERPYLQSKWAHVSKTYKSPYADCYPEDDEGVNETWNSLWKRFVGNPRTVKEMQARNDITAFAIANKDAASWHDGIREELEDNGYEVPQKSA